MYYNYSIIDGYDCPVKIVVSRRGLGKTFGKIKMCVERFVTKGQRFIYVVETGDMAKELAKNNGEKFFSAILDYYSVKNTSRKRYFFNKLIEMKVEEDEDGDKLFNSKVKAQLIGSTIKINGETAGYIVDLNSFGEIKRNNFVSVKTIIVDEFISEKLDKTTLQNPKKVSSIIQSVARLKNVNIYLLGNTVRIDDPILARMGFKIDKYGIYKKYDKFGLFAVLDFVDPEKYEEFAEAHERSVAGRFANMLGENNEEENKFLSDVPTDRKLRSFEYKKGGLSLNVVKDGTIVSIRELKTGKFACVPFTGKGTKNLCCLNEREQGYYYGYQILYYKTLRQTILGMIRANDIYYYSDIEYNKLKLIIKGD